MVVIKDGVTNGFGCRKRLSLARERLVASTSGDAAVSYAAPISSASTQTISAAAESATVTPSSNMLPQGSGMQRASISVD